MGYWINFNRGELTMSTSQPIDAVEQIWSELPAGKWLSESDMLGAICETRIGSWYKDDTRMLREILTSWLCGGNWVHVRRSGDEFVRKITEGEHAGRIVTRPVYQYRCAHASEMQHIVERERAEAQAAEAAKAARAPLEAAVERILAERAAVATV